MKNLFKNLMLVAVAAMAFTACQNDNNEVNEVVKKTVITGVATIDANDTRSGFVGKNEAGDAYVSEWDGGESIRLFYSGWSDYTEIDAEGNFELDYIGDFDPGATATVCSPGDVWSNVNEYVIPEPQTPRENSVDPMAHILKSDATEIINGTLSVKMKHAVAYGKVSFPELSLDGDAVSNVVLDIDGAEYTINTSATQNIWFACEPNGTVSNMTVTVNTNGGQALYKKIIENGNKNLSFDKGIVSTFNVKGLEQKPTEPVEADFNVTLTKVTSIVDNVIRFEGDNAEDYITIAFNPGLETIVAGHYTSVEQDWLNGGAWAWSSESALEVKNEFEGSSVEVNAVGGGTWYYDTNSNGVDVSVEDGIYTIVAHLNNAGAGNKSVDFTYVGTLEVVEPAEKFDSTYAYVYQNYGATDKEIMFVAEDGRGLRIDFYNVYENNCIVPGTYTFSGSGYMYPNWSYYYANVNGYYTSKLNSGQAVVSVEDGQYKIVFTNMALNGTVYVESFTFKGQIEGLIVPDTRAILAAPTATATADGNVITISWNEVTGADEYYVSCTNGGLDAITTTDTSVTIEAEYSTNYDFSIKAVAYDSNPDYKTSGVYNFSVTTGENPNVEYISLTSMSEGVYEDASYNYRFTFKGDNSEFILAWSYKKATSTTITSGDYAYNSNYSMLDGFGNVFGANNIYKFDGINAKINGGTIKVSSEGNIYTITMNLSLNSGDVKLFKYVGEIGVTSEPDPDQPTPDPDPTPGDGGVTIKYIKNYGGSYTYLRYYELTSGNDVIGFWMNNSNPSNTVMSNGTYKNNKNGISNVAKSPTTIHIDKSVIDGEINNSASNTSQMVVSNNGGHIEFKLDYWDTSVGSYVIREYVFDGTIQQ